MGGLYLIVCVCVSGGVGVSLPVFFMRDPFQLIEVQHLNLDKWLLKTTDLFQEVYPARISTNNVSSFISSQIIF